MTASNATISTAMISFLKRSKKKRASIATSREGGGAVGIKLYVPFRFKPASGSSYATRWFVAQAVLRSAHARPGFLRRYILDMNALWNSFETLLGLSVEA